MITKKYSSFKFQVILNLNSLAKLTLKYYPDFKGLNKLIFGAPINKHMSAAITYIIADHTPKLIYLILSNTFRSYNLFLV